MSGDSVDSVSVSWAAGSSDKTNCFVQVLLAVVQMLKTSAFNIGGCG
jgi:hypothetical protein